MANLMIGQILRYPKDWKPAEPVVDEHTNFWHVTHSSGANRAQLEKGINPIGPIAGPDGPRRPAILISSSPDRVGSVQTPWHDVFDVDNGRIRYFGDAKTPGADPAKTPGNKLLLATFATHAAVEPHEREAAVPLIFFQRTSVGGRRKGFVLFQGVGVVERAELVTQYDPRTSQSFANFVYDFAVFSMSAEHETFSWDWINARRSNQLTDAACNKLAPQAWRNWLKAGVTSIPRNRRQTFRRHVWKPIDQLPASGSKTELVLAQIYGHYHTNKHGFESLAFAITRHVLSQTSGKFVDGWITPASGDGGADFIGRLDIGNGFGAVRQIVYGQAKCTSPKSGVDGKDIARTVARLKRGWFGVFVTTSYFSEPVQREILEDEYPILLIGGRTVAEITFLLSKDLGFSTISGFLQSLDQTYESLKSRRRPEEILHF